jgi:hypothetical protein
MSGLQRTDNFFYAWLKDARIHGEMEVAIIWADVAYGIFIARASKLIPSKYSHTILQPSSAPTAFAAET